ncbi:MAG: helix-turn-helix domain-containing protein [Acidimicrobiales bacterium]
MESTAECVTAAPSPPLAPFIEGYVGYRMTGFGPGLHRGLPGRHMTFIASIGPSIDVVAQSDATQSPASYRCVVSGLSARTALIAHDGDQEGVAIELTPLGSRSLFGVPARALWNTSAECADVAGTAGRELWERLQEVVEWPDRFAACDEVLTRLVDDDAVVAPELRRAWLGLVSSKGNASISGIAADVGWSRQHLARRFADEFGLGPKLAGRLVRFGRARQMLQSTPSFVTIAQVAAACGYYDQAHLNRDFAEMAGCTPRAWLAEELPSFQDDRASVV